MPERANYDPLAQVEYYQNFNVAKQFGWTPSIAGLLGGSPNLDSFTPLTAARYTSQQYGGYLKRAASDAQVNLIDYLYQVADQYGIDRDVAYRQIFRESKFDPSAVSNKGAVGIAQFMPDTARDYGLSNRLDPYASLDAWGHYMSDLLRQFDGNYSKALGSYNWGQGRVAKAVAQFGESWLSKAPQETIDYVDYILREGEPLEDFIRRGGQYEDFTKQSKCDTFDIGCKIEEFFGSETAKDVGKRTTLILAALVLLAVAIISLR